LLVGFGDWFGGGKRNDEAHIDIAVELSSIGGSPELAYLFIDVPASDVSRSLDSWKWLPLKGLEAVAVSAFGEVFLRDPAGVIHQIDTIEGRLSRVADSLPALTAMLQEPEARDRLLLGGLVMAARQRGLQLAAGECYDFRLPPVLGGQMGVDDMTKLSFVVKLDLAGQLHEQIKDLPPGTPIDKVSIS
jgi:hypothetical protein